MIKIKEQKVPKNRVVNVVPSAARILDRLGTCGGIAILCGAYKKVETKRGSKPKKDEHADTTIQVTAAFEVFTGYDSAEESILISNASDHISKALMIAESLGLTVVGCCIGSKHTEEDLNKLIETKKHRAKKDKQSVDEKSIVRDSSRKNALWTAHHVFSSLQLQSALAENQNVNNSLIVLSVAKRSTGDLALEAYQLSDQAMTLFEKKILLTRHAHQESDHRRGKNPNKDVQLASEVLVKTEEVLSLDPVLLCIPLPIDSQATTDKSKEGEVNTKHISRRKLGQVVTASELSEISRVQIGCVYDEYEHVFPTGSELREVKQKNLARKHIGRLLRDGLKGESKDRLKDPHLLLYMSDLLDRDSMRQMCNYVSDKVSKRPSAKLSMCLDMLKMSFDDDTDDYC